METRRRINEVRNRQPDKTGEEGRIYFYGTPENPRALKEWHDLHWHKQIEQEKKVRIPISPFHHKTHYYEMNLIHALFPKHTVGVVGAADPRIQPNDSGEIVFSANADTPITVMERAASDPAKQAEYDAIMEHAYSVLLQPPQTGDDTVLHEQQIEATEEADTAVVARFGQELRHTVYEAQTQKGVHSPADVITHALDLTRAINPNSAIVRMLEYGIAPIHPQFNFVPGRTKATKERPHGTFVEVQIIDRERLVKKIAKHPKRTALQKKFERYDIFRQLDLAYTHLFRHCPQSIIDDPAVQQAAYKALLALQRLLEAKPDTWQMTTPYRVFAEIGATHHRKRDALIMALTDEEHTNNLDAIHTRLMHAADDIYLSIPGLKTQTARLAHQAFVEMMRTFMYGPQHETMLMHQVEPLLERLRPLRGSTLADEQLAAEFTRIREELSTAKTV